MEAFIYYAASNGTGDIRAIGCFGMAKRDETWINASTLTGRWQINGIISWDIYLITVKKQHLVEFARDLSNDSIDPYYITQVVIDRFMSKPLYSSMNRL